MGAQPVIDDVRAESSVALDAGRLDDGAPRGNLCSKVCRQSLRRGLRRLHRLGAQAREPFDAPCPSCSRAKPGAETVILSPAAPVSHAISKSSCPQFQTLASITRSRGMMLATRDVHDFAGIGVQLIDPWQP